MSSQVIANRYADALFQLATEKNQLDEIVEELRLVKDVVEKTPSFISYFTHPKVSEREKRDLIKAHFGSLSELSLRMLLLLVERKRFDNLLLIIDRFHQLAYEASGVAEAIIYSAKPLTDEEKRLVSEAFAKKVNKEKLVVTNVVDEKLIGGLKVRIGDTIYDGSVQAQLERLQRELIAGHR